MVCRVLLLLLLLLLFLRLPKLSVSPRLLPLLPILFVCHTLLPKVVSKLLMPRSIMTNCLGP